MSTTSEGITALVIDDEADSREVIQHYLQRYCPQVKVLGEAADIKEGLQKIKELQPQLLFLDVEMPYGNGFDLLDQIEEPDF